MINLAYNKIEANAQGTQLKRNVIIPATLQYMQPNINGVPTKFKVATIKDTKAKIFNFRGDSETEDAHVVLHLYCLGYLCYRIILYRIRK